MLKAVIAAWLKRAPVYCAGRVVMRPIEGGDVIVDMLANDLAEKIIDALKQGHVLGHSGDGSGSGDKP